MIEARYTPDLLTFESHVSGMASAVSLIVESPGSIAELGSFCLLEGVRERLMVVMRKESLDEKSFISRGPIAYLRELTNEDPNPIHIYPWRTYWNHQEERHVPNSDDLSAHADNFIDDLEDFESNLTKTQKLERKNNGHLSLLISDIISLFSALRIQEITSFLEKIGIKDIDRNKVKGHIFLLEKLGFIEEVPYGSNRYYIDQSNRSFIEYNLRKAPTDIQDRARFKLLISEELRKTDNKRLLAIRKAHSAHATEGQ